ncbi:MAG: polysaccharide deacetylase family protein [Pseudomonadota bacterium]
MQQGTMRGVISAVLLAALGAALVVMWWPEPILFPELVGPVAPTAIPETPAVTLPTTYADGSNNGIAILLKDADSSWLGLVHGFKSIGIPFRIVTTAEEALQHKVVLVYPTLTGANTAAEDLQRLAAHVRNGGTLIGFSVIGGGMPDVFGFGSSEEGALYKQTRMQASPLTAGLIDEATAATIQLGAADQPEAGLPGIAYRDLKLPAIALFEDGSGAITYNTYSTEQGSGYAYAFGLDLGHFILRAENGRFAGLTGTYVNDYQPQVDTFLRLLARIYQQGEPDAVMLSPTPHNREFTALLTHDIDFTRSMTNIPAYADLEMEAGIKATYFVQTKYVKDYSDDVFLDPSRAPILQTLQQQGMEIGSHSVAHSAVFEKMLEGGGHEQYPTYRPFVRDYETVESASITGELRVSKFLLDTLAGTDVVSFRPGHLSFPDALPQLLDATGYRYSSSTTANEAMTHLPFRLMDDRSYASEVAAYEFPVTIEDETGTLGDRFDEAVALSERIARYHGLVNVMIHTDVLDHKLEFERRFLTMFSNRAWFSTVRDFGDWWTVRDSAVMTVQPDTATTRRLQLTVSGTMAGLTLQLPAGWHYQSGLAGTTQQDSNLIAGEFTGTAELLFSVDVQGTL